MKPSFTSRIMFYSGTVIIKFPGVLPFWAHSRVEEKTNH